MIPHPDIALAERLLTELAQTTSDAGGVGICRDSYGSGEQVAHDLVAATARDLGLEVHQDAALNLYVTVPGRDRSLPAVVTGSHLDSVPCGGNFDGAAGVIAGLAVLAGWVAAGYQPLRDTTVMGIRAEESAWFPVSYPGSKAALGKLPADALGLARADGVGTLAESMKKLGGNPDAIARGDVLLDPKAIDRFLELHIEQGPALIGADIPVGIVDGIRGSFRYREASILGSYSHSGATPRSHRHDAVVALSALITRLNEAWARLEEDGKDLALTFGRVFTDPDQADFSKVPGLVNFCIDVRSTEPRTLVQFEEILKKEISKVEQETATRFVLGPRTASTPTPMDRDLVDDLKGLANNLGIKARVMSSGAGHDTATFALAGVRSVMIFVRNANGSHNPDEAMDMADFAQAVRLLGAALASETKPQPAELGVQSNA